MSEATIRRRLNVIRVVAVVDALLLAPLVAGALSGAEGVVDWLGPLHGFGFLALLFLCVRGAGGASGAGGSRPSRSWPSGRPAR